jgi:hypothetical protein
MITAASTGQMNPDSLLQIMVNTMGVTLEAATAIIAPIRNQPQPQNLAPQDTTPPPQIPTQGQSQNNAPNAQFSETVAERSRSIRSGEIYDFADRPKEPDTVEQIASNPELIDAYAAHAAKWQERINLAYAESADAVEFQERFAGIFEGMERSRQELATKYAQADRVANLAGIEEAEADGI